MTGEFTIEVAGIVYLFHPFSVSADHFYRVCFYHRDLPVVFHLKQVEDNWLLVPQSLPYYVNNALPELTAAIRQQRGQAAANNPGNIHPDQ